MSSKFVEAEEAAQMLGVTVDQLGEMRDRREVYPIRDGGAWKYKREDIERLVSERAGGGLDEFSDLIPSDEPEESILLSELELGQSEGASSTVIGKLGTTGDPESDLQISGGTSSSQVSLGGSDIAGKVDPQKAGAPSDVRLASPSELAKAGSGLSNKFEELDALDLDLPSATDSGINLVKPGGGSSKKTRGSDLAISDDMLTLGDEPSSKSGIRPGSSKKMGGSGIRLGEDDDFVLGGSGKGSDIGLSAGDSGIQLINPVDSGLSLEEAPPELGMGSGTSGIESLELSDDDILLDDASTSESATQLKSDDDFLLTPLSDHGVDESDSGSQVIALDSEIVDFDEAASTMLGGREPAMGAMEDEFGQMGGLQVEGGYGGAALAPAPGFAAAPQVVEAPFTAGAIAALALCAVLLLVSGMMTYDLMRNMWSWDGTYNVNSALMDWLSELFV
jgi:hypothetical protein